MKKIVFMFIVVCLFLSACNRARNQDQAQAEKTGGWRIAFSNAYVGNAWRAQCQKIFEAYCEQKKAQGLISEYFITSAGQDDTSQINEVRNLMSGGWDAIIVNAASPTALVPTLEEAIERGIVVVAFDNTVDSDMVYNVNCNQVELGEIQAKWMMEQLGGQGNLVIISGLEGSTNSRDRVQGYYNIIQSYIDSGAVRVLGTEYGKWDTAATAVAMNNVLSAYGRQIDGILYEGGGEVAVYEALVQNNIDPFSIPFTGEMGNGYWRLMATKGLKGVSAGDPPYLSASAVDVAIQVLNKESVSKRTWIPVPYGTEQDIDKWYAPDQPDEFFVDWTDVNNSYNLKIEQVIPDK
jgi:ribose transport system substrate-binding protein